MSDLAKSKAAERVAIAKDALAWIRAGALEPEFMTYVEPQGDLDNLYDADYNTQLRDTVLGKCKVCAIGAMFIAKAVRYNKVTVLDYRVRNWRTPLRDHFDSVQLSMIESAFEGSDAGLTCRGGKNKELLARCIAFNAKHDRGVDLDAQAKNMLTAILKNIIRNGGEFKP